MDGPFAERGGQGIQGLVIFDPPGKARMGVASICVENTAAGQRALRSDAVDILTFPLVLGYCYSTLSAQAATDGPCAERGGQGIQGLVICDPPGKARMGVAPICVENIAARQRALRLDAVDIRTSPLVLGYCYYFVCTSS